MSRAHPQGELAPRACSNGVCCRVTPKVGCAHLAWVVITKDVEKGLHPALLPRGGLLGKIGRHRVQQRPSRLSQLLLTRRASLLVRVAAWRRRGCGACRWRLGRAAGEVACIKPARKDRHKAHHCVLPPHGAAHAHARRWCVGAESALRSVLRFHHSDVTYDRRTFYSRHLSPMRVLAPAALYASAYARVFLKAEPTPSSSPPEMRNEAMSVGSSARSAGVWPSAFVAPSAASRAVSSRAR